MSVVEDQPKTAMQEAAPAAPALASEGRRGLARLFGAKPAKPPAVIEDALGSYAPPVVRSRPSGYFISFILFVALPAIAAAVYYALIASNQFVAEARFAVRTAQVESISDKLKSALASVNVTATVPTMAGQDAYIIATYIRSRAIVDDLQKDVDLRDIFRRPEADFWAKLKDNASIEDLVSYWQNMVTAYVDAPSGVVTISIKAFRPDDALKLSQAVLKASENLANSVSAHARADATRRAEGEVARAEGKVVAALADLRSFRDANGLIDPGSQAASTGTLLTGLLAQKIKLQNNYFVASRAMSPEAPTVQSLKTRLAGLDQQIDELKAKLTGDSPEAKNISAVLPKFEELELQRGFSEKLYTMAQDALERARQKAEAQSIYVSVFVPPALPEEAKFPERWSMSVLIAIGLTMVWGIFALIGAAVDDHRY